MYLCVRVSILPFSTILTFDFGIVPEVWYFLFYFYFIDLIIRDATDKKQCEGAAKLQLTVLRVKNKEWIVTHG
jgi:hypothetical protein